ncbi:BCL2 associated agonist of cell death b [Alosa alosa]|nr:BCL2 associated agonist of cell death b [Alosa alosa]
MADMYISDPESDTPEDGQGKPEATKETLFGNTLKIPSHQPPGKLSSRHRVNSEDQTCRRAESHPQDSEHGENDFFSDAPFRTRSRSAPPALWAAKKYGQQLRRMSDEFDSMLDQRGMRRVESAGTTRQMRTSRSWFASLFSHRETDGDAGTGFTASDTRTAE